MQDTSGEGKKNGFIGIAAACIMAMVILSIQKIVTMPTQHIPNQTYYRIMITFIANACLSIFFAILWVLYIWWYARFVSLINITHGFTCTCMHGQHNRGNRYACPTFWKRKWLLLLGFFFFFFFFFFLGGGGGAGGVKMFVQSSLVKLLPLKVGSRIFCFLCQILLSSAFHACIFLHKCG